MTRIVMQNTNSTIKFDRRSKCEVNDQLIDYFRTLDRYATKAYEDLTKPGGGREKAKANVDFYVFVPGGGDPVHVITCLGYERFKQSYDNSSRTICCFGLFGDSSIEFYCDIAVRGLSLYENRKTSMLLEASIIAEAMKSLPDPSTSEEIHDLWLKTAKNVFAAHDKVLFENEAEFLAYSNRYGLGNHPQLVQEAIGDLYELGCTF